MTKKPILKKFIIIALLVGTVASVTYIVVNNKKADMGGSDISGYVLGSGMQPHLTPEEIQAMMQKKVDESKIAFSINSEPVFKGKKGNIVFANPRYSAHNLDLVVTLDGKEIIKTAKISPDQYIEEISLLGKPLKKGKHSAMGLITAYDQKTDEKVGEVAVEIIITSE